MAAAAGLVLVTVVVVAALGLVRWRAAGEARVISPPAGAATPPDYEKDVADRAAIISRSMRNDRGEATVRTYTVPTGSPWLQSRKIVATQLDHWEQLGPCTDNPESTIVECAWREPTRWWPRQVTLTMMRLKTGATFVIIGSAPGE
ncbi:hypothetical protein Aab01nite_51720 [Paractinoplanes abujensis]|nr:hypothetical protein Aab01nite_51720 [Actinoplanes abujensis]